MKTSNSKPQKKVHRANPRTGIDYVRSKSGKGQWRIITAAGKPYVVRTSDESMHVLEQTRVEFHTALTRLADR